MMTGWAHGGATATAAFLDSLVEFVEALTIVLAVGTVRGWRPALAGAAAGALLLVVLVALFGPLLQAVPVAVLQIVIGLLLLLFGMRWLKKAVLRAAGIIALHDEAAAFAEETRLLRDGRRHGPWDAVALITSFKAVVLEGVEVVFIVIAFGSAGGLMGPAVAGAGVALALVIVAGLIIHRPLARVPENTLKFAVGVLLTSFGTFWFGEGTGLAWPGADLVLLALIAGYLAVALVAVMLARRIVAGGRP